MDLDAYVLSALRSASLVHLNTHVIELPQRNILCIMPTFATIMRDMIPPSLPSGCISGHRDVSKRHGGQDEYPNPPIPQRTSRRLRSWLSTCVCYTLGFRFLGQHTIPHNKTDDHPAFYPPFPPLLAAIGTFVQRIIFSLHERIHYIGIRKQRQLPPFDKLAFRQPIFSVRCVQVSPPS